MQYQPIIAASTLMFACAQDPNINTKNTLATIVGDTENINIVEVIEKPSLTCGLVKINDTSPQSGAKRFIILSTNQVEETFPLIEGFPFTAGAVSIEQRAKIEKDIKLFHETQLALASTPAEYLATQTSSEQKFFEEIFNENCLKKQSG